MSSTKDFLNKQTCQGILCVSAYSPHNGVVGRTDPALDVPIFEPAGGHPEQVRGREDHGELEEAQSNQQAQPAADSPRGPGPRLLGLRTGVFPVRLGFLVPPNKGA